VKFDFDRKTVNTTFSYCKEILILIYNVNCLTRCDSLYDF